MDAETLNLTAIKVLTTIATITGWKLPTEKVAVELLVESFEIYLKDACPSMNEKEMQYAFATQSANVKEWGKNLNLIVISEVVFPYLEERRHASEIENAVIGRLSAPAPETLPAIPPFEMLMVSWENWLLSKRVTFRWQFISVTAYDYLAENGYLVLSDEQKKVYMQHARSFIAMQMKEDEKTFYGSDLVEVRKGYAKRLAVNAYFHEAKETFNVLKIIFS